MISSIDETNRSSAAAIEAYQRSRESGSPHQLALRIAAAVWRRHQTEPGDEEAAQRAVAAIVGAKSRG